MKITHVITSPRAEGTPRLVLDWLNAETEHIQDVIFLTRENDELLPDFIRRANTITFLDPLPRGIRKIRPLIKGVKNACLAMKPDMLICWNTGLSQWVHIGARKAGVNKLLTHAGNPPYGGFVQKHLYSYLSFWIGNILGATTIVPSNYILHEFHSMRLLKKNHFARVYNCVNVTKFLRPANAVRGKDVIMVATLESHKDHTTLLKAWALIEQKMKPAKLLIVGKGTREGVLRQMVQDLGLNNVVFTGSRNDVPELLWRSGLFAFSTTTAEGFGTVLIEALAAGLPVVASDVPACREVLQGGRFGTLVAKGNADALAGGILDAMQNPGGDLAGRVEYARGFTPVKMMEQYLKIATTRR